MRGRLLPRVLLVAGGIVYLAVAGVLLVNFRSSSPQRLANADPDSFLLSRNPLFWKMRAYSALYTPNPQPQKAAEACLRVLSINPADRETWETLTDAYTQMADTAKMETAMRAASLALPYSPAPSWRWANFLILQGRAQEALPHLRTVAAADPSLRNSVYSLAWKLLDSHDGVLREVVPPSPQGRLDYARFLLGQAKRQDAYATWPLIRGSADRNVLEFGYVLSHSLVEGGFGQEAMHVWEDILAAEGRSWTKPAGDYITNGDFEAPITNKGLDWHVTQDAAYEVAQESAAPAQSGSNSLRISFKDASNPDALPAWQIVPVEPSQNYRFRGYLKTEKLTTGSGVRFLFHITSADPSKGLDLMTPSRTGTNGWIPEELCFRTAPESRLLMVQVRRLPDTGLLKDPFRGTVWVDNVSVSKATGRSGCTVVE